MKRPPTSLLVGATLGATFGLISSLAGLDWCHWQFWLYLGQTCLLSVFTTDYFHFNDVEARA